MIRRALLVAAVLASVSQAQGADLRLWIEVDGTTYLENTTAAPISFDGYQISSENGGLDPAGWISIADQVAANPLDIIAKLGAGALAFGEANPNSGNLAEVNLGGAATLPAGARFSIGKPFVNASICADPNSFAFYYKAPSGPNSIDGDAIICPEPSAWLLGALAGLGSIAFRQRRRAQIRAARN